VRSTLENAGNGKAEGRSPLPSLSPDEAHMRHAELQEHYLASRVGRNHKSNLRRAVLRPPGRKRSFLVRGAGSRGTGNNNRSRIDIVVGVKNR